MADKQSIRHAIHTRQRWGGLALLVLLLIGGLFVRLTGNSPPVAHQSPAPQAATHPSSLSPVPAPIPARVVSLLPSLTEMMFAIGAGHRVVGVSDFDDFPPEVDRLPRVGGLINPNLEAIVALEPDLIVADQSHAAGGSVSKLEALDMRVEVFRVTTATDFNDLYGVIEQLGKIFDVAEQARTLIRAMRRSVAQVTERLDGRAPVSVYCELWANPMMGVPGGSFEGHLLAVAGGLNIAESLPGRSPRISTEFVLQRDPDVILLPGGSAVPGLASPETVKQRPGWTHLRAIQHGRVYTINHVHFARHGPRSVLAVQEIARLLHPEVAWD